MSVGVPLADVHVIADADDIGHEGDHIGGFAYRLAVGDLRLALVEILHAEPEQVGGAGETETGARGIVTEQGHGQPAVEHPR